MLNECEGAQMPTEKINIMITLPRNFVIRRQTGAHAVNWMDSLIYENCERLQMLRQTEIYVNEKCTVQLTIVYFEF